MIHATLEKLLRREDMSRNEAAELMQRMVSGEFTDVQIAGAVIALRAKGETVDEIVGFVSALRAKVQRVVSSYDSLVDTCGTGGDGAHTFNISTAAAFAAAGAGVRVAKHGNRAFSSRCGSTDVLTALGIEPVPPCRVAEVIERTGIGFMFAPAHHPALRYAATARRELGVRTIFNLLGPMANPAFVKRQLLGVFDPGLTETVARVLETLGSEHVYVVHGSDGSDEVTIAGETRVTTLCDGRIETTTFTPELAGIPRGNSSSLAGGTPEENASIILSVLEGAPGPRRHAVVLNAAFVICAGRGLHDIAEGVHAAERSVDSGRARALVDELRQITAGVAQEGGVNEIS